MGRDSNPRLLSQRTDSLATHLLRDGALWRDDCDGDPVVIAGNEAILTIVER